MLSNPMTFKRQNLDSLSLVGTKQQHSLPARPLTINTLTKNNKESRSKKKNGFARFSKYFFRKNYFEEFEFPTVFGLDTTTTTITTITITIIT
jgi:hypothetical protein